MSIVKSDFPATLRVDLKVAYKEGREAVVDNGWKSLLEIVPTTSDAKQEVFYGDRGSLRRFRGERQPQTFYEYKALLTLDDWEMTQTVKKQVLDDDQSGGILRSKIVNFGRAVEAGLEKEAMDYLRDGASILGFDSMPFFCGTQIRHVYTDSTGATHGTATQNWECGISAIDATTIQVMDQHFAGLLSDQNKVLGMQLTDVVVRRGSVNAKNARELANSQFTVEASTVRGTMTQNVFQGYFNIIQTNYGLSLNEWIALALNDPEMKPLKVLSHVKNGFENLEFTQLLDESESGFWRNEYAFGVFGRFGFNVGDWRTAYLHGASSASAIIAVTDLERQRLPE
jgi:phage major head subunit gpT-like protein